MYFKSKDDHGEGPKKGSRVRVLGCMCVGGGTQCRMSWGGECGSDARRGPRESDLSMGQGARQSER